MRKNRIRTVFLTIAVIFTMSFAALPAYAASGTAITNADDLKAMENNPSGSYYLANDIEVPASLSLFADYDRPFTGTLDGNGHTLKGYSYTSSEEWLDYVALFIHTKNATFKNLRMTDVNINLNQADSVAALAATSTNCKFIDISVSGKIVGKYLRTAAGILAYNEGSSMTGCKNSADITVTDAAEGGGVAGVAGSCDTMKNCTNSGKISISGKITQDGFYAAGVANRIDKATACRNSGAVTVSATGSGQQIEVCTAAGVADEVNTAVSCGNTGKVSMNATIKPTGPHMIGGVFAHTAKSASKCYNKGAVSYSGKSYRGVYVGGVSGEARKISQSYNKGSVTLKIPSAKSAEENKVGGVCGTVKDMRNCYNTGTITATGVVFIGGISGYADPWDDKVVSNYNTGKIKATTKGTYKGQVLAGYEGTEVVQKRNIYNNYYTGSGTGYDPVYSTPHKYVAKASKVSSIKAKNCPKLSSKYWTYSSKYGRMILKNNKEK